MTQKERTKKFIEKARKVHNDKYDYSKVEYINAYTKVCIICPIHGEFWMSPSNHCTKSNNCECPKCSGRYMDTLYFIEKARKIHGNKYDYSKVEYINSQVKVCIICSEHGEFWQTPNKHLIGHGCAQCHEDNKKYYKLSNTEEFIKKARKIHGDKYDYSKVEYINNHTKVCIICPEHGEFWQIPSNHLRYKGCPKCKSSHLQTKVRKILNKNKINFEEEKICDFFKKGKAHQSLDFYLPDYNIGIECQGKQHFEPVNFGGKLTEEEMNNNFNSQIKRDKLKKELCTQNNIELIYINYNDKNIEEKINNIIYETKI